MENKPVVQNFLGKPVRFYKTTFGVEMTPRNTGSSMREAYSKQTEMRGRNAPSSRNIFTVETYAIPFPDFCQAIGYDERSVTKLIRSSRDVFEGLHRVEKIPDSLGRIQSTIMLSQEMADGLVFKISTSRIKDEATRNQVIDFQRFIMLTIGLIRRGKLKMTHDLATSFSCPPDYQNLLTLPSGRDLKRAVGVVADREGISAETVYRKLRRLRGSNVINSRGIPRKQRAA